MDSTFSMPSLVEEGTVKCPCSMCRNYVRLKRIMIELHLCKMGSSKTIKSGLHMVRTLSVDKMKLADGNMLVDIANVQVISMKSQFLLHELSSYRMVVGADEMVHEKIAHSHMSAIARIIDIKLEYNMFISCYDDLLELIKGAATA